MDRSIYLSFTDCTRKTEIFLAFQFHSQIPGSEAFTIHRYVGIGSRSTLDQPPIYRSSIIRVWLCFELSRLLSSANDAINRCLRKDWKTDCTMSFPVLELIALPDEDIIVSDTKISKPTQQEIKLAFSFLDIDKSGQVSLANLKKRLGIFFPDMTAKEYKFLMNNRKELTIEDLTEFLSENEISDADFDPIAEAFKVERIVCLTQFSREFVTRVST